MTYTAEGSKKTLPKLLIADDDPAIVSLLADRCAKMGFSVETATNGLQLLIKAHRNHPDMIIVDVNMPELDGLSACARLLNPGSQPVDVIVITGEADLETVARCESLGLYYGRKGPEFWKSIETALTEIFPKMVGEIAGLVPYLKNAEVYARPRVLLIDDDSAMEQFYCSRFKKLGIEMLYASNATAGYRIACRTHPSAIITENSMPNGDARHLLFRLRSNPATESIPVIVLSGQRLDEPTHRSLSGEICGRPGAAHILEKSLDTQELFQALQSSVAMDKHLTKF
jgi:CheY-like chemotaxis protein